jgi:hypothetical protein
MKVALTLLLLVATGTSVFAAETAPASSAADEAYQRFRAVRYAQVPRLADVQETSRLQMKQHDESSRLAEKFYEQFPADARKWEIIGVAVNSPRQFSGPDAAAEQAAWEKKRNEWRRMLLADAGVPANIWTTVAEWTIGDMAGISRGPAKWWRKWPRASLRPSGASSPSRPISTRSKKRIPPPRSDSCARASGRRRPTPP